MSAPAHTRMRPAPDEVLEGVYDPEIPVLTIADLGILRSVGLDDSSRVQVVITPTYSGCPAMDAIRDDIKAALAEAGYLDVSITTVLAPAWTTDWITARGRARLAEFGIAPPQPAGPSGPVPLILHVRRPDVACPQCGSADTAEVSRFSSTACKAAYVCRSCREPFDYFKAL